MWMDFTMGCDENGIIQGVPVNKQGKKSGEVMRSDEFLPQFRALFAERGGYFSPQDWYDRLDLGKTLKGMIAAREADEIIRKLSFKSFEADYKTMLIWLPEAMNEEAANKILKILEEPWDRTLFILVCEHPDRLLPTIVSRTQEVCVPRIAPDVLERVAQQRPSIYSSSPKRSVKGTTVSLSFTSSVISAVESTIIFTFLFMFSPFFWDPVLCKYPEVFHDPVQCLIKDLSVFLCQILSGNLHSDPGPLAHMSGGLLSFLCQLEDTSVQRFSNALLSYQSFLFHQGHHNVHPEKHCK